MGRRLSVSTVAVSKTGNCDSVLRWRVRRKGTAATKQQQTEKLKPAMNDIRQMLT